MLDSVVWKVMMVITSVGMIAIMAFERNWWATFAFTIVFFDDLSKLLGKLSER